MEAVLHLWFELLPTLHAKSVSLGLQPVSLPTKGPDQDQHSPTSRIKDVLSRPTQLDMYACAAALHRKPQTRSQANFMEARGTLAFGTLQKPRLRARELLGLAEPVVGRGEAVGLTDWMVVEFCSKYV